MLGSTLAQLPGEDLDREILVRADIGGATHTFTADCRDAGIRFWVGYELTETVRQAILDLPDTAWVQAINADGIDRECGVDGRAHRPAQPVRMPGRIAA